MTSTPWSASHYCGNAVIVTALSVIMKVYHLHAFLSLVNLNIQAIKKHSGAKDNSSLLACCVLCEQRTQTATSLICTSCLNRRIHRKVAYVKITVLPSNFVDLTMINLYLINTVEYRCTGRPDIFYFISNYLLFCACTRTALQ